MVQPIPATVFAAVGLLVLAIPGAAWVAGFEASAGRQAPAIEGGALGRFMKSTLAAHLVLAPVSLMAVVWALRGSAGVDLHGGLIQAWIVPIAVLVAVLLVYAVGPLVLGYASGTRVRSRGTGLLAGAVERIRQRAEDGSVLSRLPAPSKGLLYPRAWDFVFSQNRPLYLRARLHSGRWIAGFVGRHEHDLTESYATSHPHEPEVFCVHRVEVDPATGAWLLDAQGHLMIDPHSGLIVRANDCEHMEIAYGYPVEEEVAS